MILCKHLTSAYNISLRYVWAPAASILLCYWRHKVLCKQCRTGNVEPPSPAKPAQRPQLEPSNGRTPSLQQWLADSIKDFDISKISPSNVMNVHFDGANQGPGAVRIPRPRLHSTVMGAPCLLQQEDIDSLLQTSLH